jgi:hypothetical protein
MTVLRLQDVRDVPDACVPGLHWRPVRATLGVTGFGINAYTAAEPGDIVVEPHDEADSGHDEVYVVVAGAARFVLDGAEHDAAAISFVRPADPGVHREARALEPGTVVLAVGAPAGGFEPSDWERRELAKAGA